MRGFSLIEVVVAVAVFALLISSILPLTHSYRDSYSLTVASTVFASAIRRAELLAGSMASDSSWGVSVATSTITVFKGTSYAARDTNYDEPYSIAASVLVTGTKEIVFSKFSRTPNTTVPTTFSIPSGQSRTFTLNAKGTLTY